MPTPKNSLDYYLHRAIVRNDKKSVRKLLRNGADINAKNEKGLKPLHALLSNYRKFDECFEVFRILIISGADVNERSSVGTTPLYHALAKNNHNINDALDVIQTLIDFGADVNKTFSYINNEWPPIIYAIFSGNKSDVIQTLINSGSDVNVKWGDQKATPLYYSVKYRPDDVRMINLLLASGAIVNTQCANDRTTPLHLAASYATIDVFQTLLDAGADVSIQDHCGETPFDIVKRNKHTDIGAAMYMKLMMYS